MGAECTHLGYAVIMSKVMQIRDVPEDVHDALVRAAHADGLSLTRYMLRELERLAQREQVVRDNILAVRQTQAEVRGGAERDTILSVLWEGRGE